MTPESKQVCPVCRAQKFMDGNVGLCPRCLLRVGMTLEDEPASEQPALASGLRLGPYRIAEQIGRGGMGEVYLATDTRLDRMVAIKVLPGQLASDPQRRERFEREAKAVSRLSHPHICALYDVGEQDGAHYLVMERVEGQTLEAQLDKGRLPLEKALEYAAQIADALDSAHHQGVVHRDLKPSNIMLTRSGVKLLDFGLAKFKKDTSSTILQMPRTSNLERSSTHDDGVFGTFPGAAGARPLPSQARTEDHSLTAAGTILGTLQYMAPEQLEGKAVDGRADIFAFGAVVYEMVTGKRAFQGTSQASLIAAIMNSHPQPMSELEAKTPPTLDHIVGTCLAKDPTDRWQTARDVAREIRRLSAGRQASSAGGRSILNRGRLLGAGAFLAVAAQVVRAHVVGDPWITGYAISTLLVAVLFSLVIISCEGRDQKHFVFAVFFIVAVLVAGAVWWRYMDVRQFLTDPQNLRRPAGLCYGHWGLMPYLSVLGSWIIFTTYMVYAHTRKEINRSNRGLILVAFTILVVYLLGARLVWESVDNRGLDQLRQYPSIESNC